MSKSKLMGRLLQTSILAGAMVAMAAPAVAQDEDAETIVVTGSRIKKQDFISNSPVATIGSEQFEFTNTVNTESLLNTLPQTIPGLDRTSNNPGGGIATVDLRGLGSTRTLVLINGTRATPTTQGGTVDINTIPTALIESVEVLTGGASAVYGSDAVAGVVNFILKDDFEGVQLSSSYEVTQESDAGIFSADLTMGSNFADGRGNVVFNLSYTDRDDLFQGDRDFSTFAQFDDVDADGNPILIDGGSSGVPATSIFAGGFGTFSPDSFGIIFNEDGSIRPFETGDTNDFYNYAPVNYIQLPQTRYQGTALGHFEINDHAEVYGRGMFTYSAVPQQLAPTPIFQTTAFTLDGNPFITADAQQTISDAIGLGVDTDGDGIDDEGSALLRRRLEEVGPRIVDDITNSFQIKAGIRGAITDSWDYDVYAQQGIVTFSSTQFGNVNRDRFNQALLLETDAAGNVVLNADGTPNCADTSSNGSTSACSPLNIFGEGNISADAAQFLRTAVSAVGDLEQLVVSGNVSGDFGSFLQLPGGSIGAAGGVEYIELTGDFRPSQDLAAGTIAGFNGSPASGGSYNSYAAYGELYFPILKGAPLAELLDLELAYRTTDYSTVGDVSSYKIAGSWAPNDQVRFRASLNTAVRAPSIAELFSPQGEGFPGSTDPCAAEGAPDAAAQAVCAATGVPTGVINSAAINLAAGQVRQLSGGNPDLTEETVDTYTAGVVWSPSFVDGLTMSVDYFDITIEDAISAFGGGANNVLQTCYTDADLGGVGSPFCNAITRRADGTIDFVSVTSQNVAEITLNGFDIVADYSFDLAGGVVDLNYLGTVTQESDFIAFAGADPITCAGEFGNDCGEPVPEYSHRATATWSGENLTAQVLWRHIGETSDDDEDTTYFVETLDAENYFDVSGTYQATESFSMTLGVDNVFDTSPPILGDNQEQANTYPATYDVFGRTFFIRGVAKF